MLGVDPVGQPLVLELRHHERPGPGEERQTALGDQVDEGAEVALGAGRARYVEGSVGQLVEQPRDVGGDAVSAQLDREIEPGGPLRPGHPEVVHLTGQHQRGPAVDHDPPPAHLDHSEPPDQLVIVTRAELPRAELGPMITSTSPGSTR